MNPIFHLTYINHSPLINRTMNFFLSTSKSIWKISACFLKFLFVSPPPLLCKAIITGLTPLTVYFIYRWYYRKKTDPNPIINRIASPRIITENPTKVLLENVPLLETKPNIPNPTNVLSQLQQQLQNILTVNHELTQQLERKKATINQLKQQLQQVKQEKNELTGASLVSIAKGDGGASQLLLLEEYVGLQKQLEATQNQLLLLRQKTNSYQDQTNKVQACETEKLLLQQQLSNQQRNMDQMTQEHFLLKKKVETLNYQLFKSNQLIQKEQDNNRELYRQIDHLEAKNNRKPQTAEGKLFVDKSETKAQELLIKRYENQLQAATKKNSELKRELDQLYDQFTEEHTYIGTLIRTNHQQKQQLEKLRECQSLD